MDHGGVIRRHQLTNQERGLLARLIPRTATALPRVEDQPAANGHGPQDCRLQVDDRGAGGRVEAQHRQFAAVDGFDGTARHPDAVGSAGAAAGEDTDGREVGAAALRAGFAVVVVFRELVEDEEDLHVGALQILEARLAEAFPDRGRRRRNSSGSLSSPMLIFPPVQSGRRVCRRPA